LGPLASGPFYNPSRIAKLRKSDAECFLCGGVEAFKLADRVDAAAAGADPASGDARARITLN